MVVSRVRFPAQFQCQCRQIKTHTMYKMTKKEKDAVADFICSVFAIVSAFAIGLLCAFGLN